MTKCLAKVFQHAPLRNLILALTPFSNPEYCAEQNFPRSKSTEGVCTVSLKLVAKQHTSNKPGTWPT